MWRPERYSTKAAEMRRRAETALEALAREQFLEIAREYEKLAEQAEAQIVRNNAHRELE
jgi:hypothetical protein